MATLSEMRALTSKKYVAEQVMNIPDLLKILKIFGQRVFASKNSLQNAKFLWFFATSQKTFGGYFE